MPTYPPIQPRSTDGLIQVIAARLDNLHEDVSGMRKSSACTCSTPMTTPVAIANKDVDA